MSVCIYFSMKMNFLEGCVDRDEAYVSLRPDLFSVLIFFFPVIYVARYKKWNLITSNILTYYWIFGKISFNNRNAYSLHEFSLIYSYPKWWGVKFCPILEPFKTNYIYF